MWMVSLAGFFVVGCVRWSFFGIFMGSLKIAMSVNHDTVRIECGTI